MERIEGMIGNVGELYHWPPFFFHYIIASICVFYVICVCILKFKYLFWYNQPITFQFTLRRFLRGNGCMNTSIMYPLSLGKRYNNAVVYPFLHFVDHKSVIVYGCSRSSGVQSITDAPYEKLAAFLSRREMEVVAPTRRRCLLHGGEGGEGGNDDNDGSDIMYIPPDKFEYMLSQETHGLSVFIGVLEDKTTHDIKGVCVLTPRIMLSFSGVKMDVPHQAVSIYVCEHLAWSNYITKERESLELLETTEYIQKSREIAGEQTLYRYREIPRFVVPFTTVYTYMFHGIRLPSSQSSSSLGNGLTLVPISSANFALFYTFVNECTRDFRYSIFNELTHLQSLVQGGIYMIYMLLLNHMRVVAVYIFEPSWLKVRPMTKWNNTAKTKTNKTRGNRISSLHDHISRTSTAVVKYLPPVTHPKYDAFGKRVNRSANKTTTPTTAADNKSRRHSHNDEHQDILLLKSSIRHKLLCDCDVFVRGFIAAASSIPSTSTSTSGISTDTIVVCIDTIAHNYQIIDALMTETSPFHFLSKDKWYYILYNAIIHQEILCKDLLVI
jgi:hypothetical protein